MKVSAILVAAGSGSRLAAGVPKALVEIGGISLLMRSTHAVARVDRVSQLVVVAPPGHESSVRADLDREPTWSLPVLVVGGGAERQDSVRAGLDAAGDVDFVAIHDAARPFIEPRVIEETIAAAIEHGAAIVGIPASDTIKEVDADGWVVATPPRARLWQVQTPQVFRTDILRAAHRRAVEDGWVGTDDSALVERLGVRVHMVCGTPNNRKVTTPDDLRWAEWYATTLPSPR